MRLQLNLFLLSREQIQSSSLYSSSPGRAKEGRGQLLNDLYKVLQSSLWPKLYYYQWPISQPIMVCKAIKGLN